MKEIEAYEKQLMTTGTSFGIDINTNRIVRCGIVACMDCLFYKNTDCNCSFRAMEWLLSEHKEPILDDIEREYLSAIIKPFRSSIQYIAKCNVGDGFQQIIIAHEGEHYTSAIDLPPFDNDMYMGMKLGEKYSIEDLGL